MAKELTYKRDKETGIVYLDEGQTFNEEVAARLVDFTPNPNIPLWRRRMEADKARLGVKEEPKKESKKDKKDKKSLDDLDL